MPGKIWVGGVDNVIDFAEVLGILWIEVRQEAPKHDPKLVSIDHSLDKIGREQEVFVRTV